MYHFLDLGATEVARTLIHSSRSRGTSVIYNASLKHWLAFVPTNPSLRADPFLERSDPHQNLLLAALFLDFLVRVQHLTYSSLKLAWCAVSAYFDESLRDSSPLRSPMIQRTYRGALTLTKRLNPTQHRPARLPLGLETLHEVRPAPGSHSLSDPSIMPELASRLAAHYGTRLGEYTFDPTNDDGPCPES